MRVLRALLLEPLLQIGSPLLLVRKRVVFLPRIASWLACRSCTFCCLAGSTTWGSLSTSWTLLIFLRYLGLLRSTLMTRDLETLAIFVVDEIVLLCQIVVCSIQAL